MPILTRLLPSPHAPNRELSSDRYEVRIAQTQKDIESALRLRYEVFDLELADEMPSDESIGLEFDEFDYRCRHLIVVEKRTQKTVGTYRLNSIEDVGEARDLYAFTEFTIEDLPEDVLVNAVEIGRACIAFDHRNTRVLFLLWKGLADYVKKTDKRFLFGCCSIFTTEREIGMNAFEYLKREKFLHTELRVRPRDGKACASTNGASDSRAAAELPDLFNMYLKIGAKVCGEPVVDSAFGTIDFFVIFDVQALNGKYRRMFFGDPQTKIPSESSDMRSLPSRAKVY